MRSITFNFVENLFGRILFASFYTLVTIPWLNFAFQGAAGVNAKNQFAWFALAVILGGLVLQISNLIKRDWWARCFILAVIPVLAYLLSQFAFLWVENVTDVGALKILGVLSMTLYLLLGFRYQKTIRGQIEFMSEFSLLTVMMLINLLINNRLNFEIGYQQILYFFITGIALGTYRKFKEIHYTAAKSTRSWLMVTLAVVGFVSLFAAIFTSGFSEEAIQLVLAPIFALLVGLRNLIILLMEYVLLVLAPVLDFLFAKLKIPTRTGQPREGMEIYQYYRSKVVGMDKDQIPLTTYNWLLWGLIILVVVIILLVVILRLRRTRDSEKGYDEVRESLFTAVEVKEDFLHMLQSLTRRFQRREVVHSIYDGSSNALRIREIYHRFISRLHPKVPFRKFYTPKDYLAKIHGQVSSIPAAELTQIYEQARYSPNVGTAEVSQMEQAYERANGEPSQEPKP